MDRCLSSSAALRLGLLVVSLAWTTGCSSYQRLLYTPKPAVATVDGGAAQTFVSVLGVRPADDSAGAPVLEMRLLVENLYADTVDFDPNSLTIRTGDLQELRADFFEPSGPFTLGPQQTVTANAYVPLLVDPSGNVDLSTLTVSWRLRVDGVDAPGSVTLNRKARARYPHPYYDASPYWYRHPYGYYGGYGRGYGRGSIYFGGSYRSCW